MNKILVFEFITTAAIESTGMDELSPSLLAEAGMIVRSVVSDLAELEDVEIWVTRDPRLDDPDFPKCVTLKKVTGNFLKEFRRLCEQVDFVLPIAPETDNILETLNRVALDTDVKLLGTDPNTVSICASKYATARYLTKCGIPVVETTLAGTDLPGSSNGWVVKPDLGIGSEQVFLTQSESEVIKLTEIVDNAVIQPYLPGEPVSLSLLCENGQCIILGYNQMLIQRHQRHEMNTLRYMGSRVNFLREDRVLLDQIAQSVSRVFPGLRGYTGLDLIMDRGQPVILEINPRLTTSYCGLNPSTGLNPVALIIESALQGRLPELKLSDSETIDILVPE